MLISRITRVTLTFVVFASVCLGHSTIAVAQQTMVFASNYDAKLEVGDNLGRISSRTKVRNESTFPIEYQHHRVDVTITEGGDRDFEVSLNILEKNNGEWSQINTHPLSFEGSYSVPVTYKWSVGDVALDLAIAVSKVRQ